MSMRCLDVIRDAEVIAGYTVYVDLIKGFISGKKVIATTMKKEVDRVKAAVDTALSGRRVALVSSGDPGIYAMAGLALEIIKEKGVHAARPGDDPPAHDGLTVEVVPGIPALSSGGSLLGAPLTHDFACISLSDLLTPWELIEKRLNAAAEADFVMVIFNPKSRKRGWQLSRAQEIALRHRSADTPVGIVRSAMREGQDVTVVPLKDLDKADVDMLTTVFIGNSASEGYLDFMFTPRGYGNKYDLK